MFFKPDRYFSRISRIDIERDVLGCGFTHILCDVDNTILTRDDHTVPVDVMAWIDKARAAEVSICLLSNNFHHGVQDLAQRLDLPVVAKAVKPLPHGFIRAKRKLGGTRKDTLVIGDQLITDVIGAHICGLKAYMLVPLVEKDLWHTLLLRHLERAILGKLRPEDEVAPFPDDVSDGVPAMG
ncbi:MAG: YqeG family HAD IIIA-type phosphatase [Eggerthellaceae bacterium]|nr:YqeG family HAD IIIA-type phosphatase [Eggerthellaceae bacterium]